MTGRGAILMTTAALVLGGCGFGESRLNPVNWFRSDAESESVPNVEIVVTEETRPLVAQITGLVVEPTPGGAIIRATALPPVQGWYDSALVRETPDGLPVDGTLTFSFRARPPLTATRASTVQSRELTAGIFVTANTLAGVSRITVTGATNARTARR